MAKQMNPELVMVLEDHREGSCAFCRESCEPSIRFVWQIDTEEQGTIFGEELETCSKCASKVRKNWKALTKR